MNKIATVVLVFISIIYWISPIDLFPGPIDDAIVSIINAGIIALINSRKKK